jgi:hypothetical protein
VSRLTIKPNRTHFEPSFWQRARFVDVAVKVDTMVKLDEAMEQDLPRATPPVEGPADKARSGPASPRLPE